MSKLLYRASVLVLLTGGIILLLLPIHMQTTGLVFLLLGLAMILIPLLERSGHVLTAQLLVCCAASCVILLSACMCLIASAGAAEPTEALTADYAIVLGSAVREDGQPSRIMRERLEAACRFMDRNPDALVILSGGQGEDEPVSEAVCMYTAITAMGADPSRLMLEDESHTTRENLLNTIALVGDGTLIGQDAKRTVLITSGFHTCRALWLADRLGLPACAWPARDGQWFYRVNYTLREVFAFVKAYIQTA